MGANIYQYIILAIVFAIALVVYYVMNSGNATLSNKRMIWTLLGIAASITLFGLLGLVPNIEDSIGWFILLQAVFLGLGILSVYLFSKDFFGEFKYKIASEITILVFNVILGIIGFTLLFNFLNKSDLGFSMATSAICFLIPYCVIWSFKILASIPQEIFKVWYLNEDAAEPDFDKINVRKIFLLELELMKNVNAAELTNIKVKAPIEMKFGEWFQSFILNYNGKFDDDPIQFQYLDGESMGWVFHTKPSFFKSKKFIDANLTIEQNHLSEKIAIIAKRVQVTYK